MKLWMALPIGLALVVSQGPAAMAQAPNTNSCQADIAKLCITPGSKPTPESVKACLILNKDKLSPDCKKIFSQGR